MKDVKGGGASLEAEQHVEQLEAELSRNRNELERTVQDLEAANEELKSSNEELLSINDELQSANEELETSNEELLSINEELQSANEELETSKEDVQAANTALASANNDLRNLLLSMQIATIFLDAEGLIRSFTPAATELYNILSGDIGRPFSHFTHRLSDLPPMPAIRHLGDAKVVEDQARHDDGRWFLRRIVAYDSGAGRFEGTIVSFIDISAQKDAEDALRESEGRLSKVLENLAAMVGLLELDGTLIEANQTALVPARLSRADVLGKKFWETYWWNYDPDVQATLKDAIARAGRDERVRYDVAVRIADDQLMIIDFQISPLRDADGRITHLVPSAVDVTERKRIAEELSIREARYRTLFERASVGIAKVGLDGRLIGVNPSFCDILGYSSEELLKLTFADVTYPSDLDKGLDALRRLGSGEILHFTTEKRYVRKDGSVVWCNLSSVRHEDEDGEAAYYVSVVVDIDARKKAEATRELLIEELNHRVRNMLTVVKSIASQTLRHSASLETFGTAFEGRVQALATTHTMLSDSKWLGSPLGGILEQQLRHASGKGAFDLEGPLVSLNPKPSLALSLVFHELGTNAMKYGALATQNGRVVVSWDIVKSEQGDQQLHIGWQETGGPPVLPPTRTGFGSKLIDINISHEFDGKILRDYRPDGLVVTIDIPWNPVD